MPCVEERKLIIDVATPLAVRVTLVGLKEDVAPLGETIMKSDTVPVKLLMLETEIVEVVEEPANIVRAEVETETLKSTGAPTITVNVTGCDNVPLTPVTVTVYCPWVVVEATEIFNIEVAEVVVGEINTLVGVRVAVNSRLGVVAVRVTPPVNPLSPATVMVADVDEPGCIDGGERLLAEIEKSVTTTVIATLWDSIAPLESVIVPFTVPS